MAPQYSVSEINGDDWSVVADRADGVATVASRMAQGLGHAPYELLENGQVIATIEHRPTKTDRWACVEVGE